MRNNLVLWLRRILKDKTSIYTSKNFFFKPHLFLFRYVDGSWRFKSLDDIWYYGGQDEHQQEAVLRHEVEGKSGEVGFFMKV